MPILLQISVAGNTTSTGTFAENIGKQAVAAGWDCYVAFGRLERKSALRKIKIGTIIDIYWHVLFTRFTDRHGFASKHATRKLIRQIEKIKPDVIHLHNIHGYYINIEILFKFLAQSQIPIVWSLYDCWAMTGHCAYFDSINCSKWQTQCGHCLLKKTYPASLLIDNSRQNYFDKQKLFTSVAQMTIVPGSEWLCEIAKKSFLKSQNMHVIYSGIDTNIFSPKSNVSAITNKYDLNNKFVVLGVASVWEKRKGLADFIQLHNKLNDKKFAIVLVGITQEQKNKLPNEIVAIERTENIEELAQLYSVADVFVNPTWEDNFPTTNLEALACGTPVITYNTGGSVEAISETTGLIVEKGNIAQLVDAITTICENGKSFYSKNCRKRAVALYNMHDRYDDYIKLYNQLLITR
jgi:glycosyltransferase involved in cell wall biosynthesis